MKRTIIALLLIILVETSSFAAMTCVDSGTYTGTKGGVTAMITCTFDTTPGTAVDTVPASVMRRADDQYVYTFATTPGSTGPTINSDLQIIDCRSVTIISATGNGADVIDNSTSTGPIYGDGPVAGTTNHYPQVHEWCAWTITVTNNAVNSSSFILYMEADK